jgi:hypothetical protein
MRIRAVFVSCQNHFCRCLHQYFTERVMTGLNCTYQRILALACCASLFEFLCKLSDIKVWLFAIPPPSIFSLTWILSLSLHHFLIFLRLICLITVFDFFLEISVAEPGLFKSRYIYRSSYLIFMCKIIAKISCTKCLVIFWLFLCTYSIVWIGSYSWESRFGRASTDSDAVCIVI